jgi:hypothetical protein
VVAVHALYDVMVLLVLPLVAAPPVETGG